MDYSSQISQSINKSNLKDTTSFKLQGRYKRIYRHKLI